MLGEGMIKEYATYAGKNHFVIRNDHFDSSFKVIKELIQEAKEDFPELKDDDIKVVQFGGEQYPRTFGIEFSFDESISPPSDYEFVSRLEVLL